MKHTFFVMLTLLASLLVSCEHKELCYHHPHTAKVRVDVDWSRFTKESPTGMTVMAYPVNGGKPQTVLTHTLDHTYFNLEEGAYHTLVFNQSTTEFGSVEFRHMDDYTQAEVISATVDGRWYTGRTDGGRVAAQPEWIASDFHEGGVVSHEMVEEARYTDKYRRAGDSEYLLCSLTPENIIYSIKVKVNIKGIYNLRSARAALDGMAEGYRFASAKPTTSVSTYLMEEWRLTVDQNDPTQGYIESSLYCFGLPDGHRATAGENHFVLYVLLVDNKTTLDCTFPVGDKFDYDEAEVELSLSLEIDLQDPLPDVKPEGGSGSGFDATVEDWGEEIEHDIQM